MDDFEDLSDIPIEILRTLPKGKAYGERYTAKVLEMLGKYPEGLKPWQMKIAYWREYKASLTSARISSILGALVRRGKVVRSEDGIYQIKKD